MTTRLSFLQEAEAAIRREILEGPEHAFFAGIPVTCADDLDIETAVQQALAETSLALLCEVSGGPVPVCPGDAVPWDATVTIAEAPAVNRAGTSAKTADLALEALLRAHATLHPDCFFVAQEVEPFRVPEKGLTGYIVRGAVHVVPVSDAAGEAPPCF